jgi:hypothetical protein
MLFMARSVRETEAKKSLRRHIQKKLFISISLPAGRRTGAVAEARSVSDAYLPSGRAQRA